MNKLLVIFLFFLFSCGHESIKQRQSTKIKDTIPTLKDTVNIVRLDSAYPGHEAFNWNWERPTEKIILSSFITKYIKKGQEPIDTFLGDINNDNILDLLLVTGIIGEDSLRFSKIDLPRELLVFTGKDNKSYKFLFKNPKAIPCRNCCGMSDPYAGMAIKNGQIIINEYCASNWKSISEYRFRYNTKLADWLLDTVVHESYAFDHEYYNLDTTTQKDFGKKSLRRFVIYEDDEK
jgi:hypothetical protein